MENNSTANWQNALRQLPQYTPPPAVWQQIDAALTESAPLQAAIRSLPVYPAPSAAWLHIAAALDQAPSAQTRWIQVALPWATAAAVVLTLSLIGIWWSKDPAPRETYVFSQETLPSTLLSDPDPAAEQDIAAAKAVYQQFANIRTPDVDLEAAMAELELAKAELETAIDTYGPAPDLVRQLDRLERDRAKLAREMAAVALY